MWNEIIMKVDLPPQIIFKLYTWKKKYEKVHQKDLKTNFILILFIYFICLFLISFILFIFIFILIYIFMLFIFILFILHTVAKAYKVKERLLRGLIKEYLQCGGFRPIIFPCNFQHFQRLYWKHFQRLYWKHLIYIYIRCFQ